MSRRVQFGGQGQQPRGRWYAWRRVWGVLRPVLALGILAYVVGHIRPAQFLRAATAARADLLILLLAMGLANLAFQVLKWKLVVSVVWPELPVREALESFTAGLSLGILTPGRLGEVSRAFFLPGRNRAVGVGLALLDKLYTISVVVVLGVVAIAALAASDGTQLGWLGLMAFVWLGFLAWPRTIRSIGKWIGGRFEWAKELAGASSVVRLKHTLGLLAVNLVYAAYLGVQFTTAVRAFSYLEFTQGVLAGLAALGTKALIPISIGDVGVREAAAVFFYQKAGASAAGALSGALSLYVVNVAFPALIGLRWVAGPRRKHHALKKSVAENPREESAEMLG